MVMNMNNLELFMKVAEKMSITEASKELFISQPAVSKAVKNLEKHLDIKLFIRDKKNGLLLTEVGKEILILARQMKGIENKIYQVANQENKLLSGKIKVGSFPAASTNILTKTIVLFRAKYPLVNIELIEGTSNQIKKWVEDRTVDMGIVASPFEPYESKVLNKDHMVAIIPDNHSLNQEKSVNLKKYQDDIIFCKGGHEVAIAETFETNNIKFKENLTVHSAETLISMVKNNLGIGVISNFTLSSVSHNLIIKEIIPRITRHIGIITHSFNEVTPATREFINIMASSYNENYTN
ncbi:LysR family transcriptional regulator [Priestia filamentosa]|uniref:LysR family transcriptional regulator n=1 Tax=Priestia filamentosa TaxID=1402861 RepID=UPI001FB2F3DF|nr:LysR family transcriptional regulator [Priestia filamentosa]MED3727869.1 LysR family transcriptional regulator [Priestia filamentosa]UOE60256.1 LysR family transcriptional regulator [Priestia filamentosa]